MSDLRPGEVHRSEGDPHNRLTRLCEAMTAALDAHPERGAEKAIVFLQDGGQGGLQLHGYDSDTEAVADLLIHLRAIMRANGKDLAVVGVGRG